mmetsp:Transcript_11158/g.16935  ORF Transcript_11158/g.16935 Transcript_11158/m.16935 type:complete len:95 (+) Transcript_11158:408-692(+)
MYSISEVTYVQQLTTPVYCIMFDQYCKASQTTLRDECRKFQFICSQERNNLEEAQKAQVEDLKMKLIFILVGSIILVFAIYKLIRCTINRLSAK